MRGAEDDNVPPAGLPGSSGFILDLGGKNALAKTHGQGAVIPGTVNQAPARDAVNGMRN